VIGVLLPIEHIVPVIAKKITLLRNHCQITSPGLSPQTYLNWEPYYSTVRLQNIYGLITLVIFLHVTLLHAMVIGEKAGVKLLKDRLAEDSRIRVAESARRPRLAWRAYGVSFASINRWEDRPIRPSSLAADHPGRRQHQVWKKPGTQIAAEYSADYETRNSPPTIDFLANGVVRQLLRLRG
jgi:hypothetical protein